MNIFIFGLVGRFVGGRLVVPFVLDVGNVARVAINVIVDNLLATIGKNDPVVASGLVTFTTLVLTEIIVVVVLHSPVKFVVSQRLNINF